MTNKEETRLLVLYQPAAGDLFHLYTVAGGPIADAKTFYDTDLIVLSNFKRGPDGEEGGYIIFNHNVTLDGGPSRTNKFKLIIERANGKEPIKHIFDSEASMKKWFDEHPIAFPADGGKARALFSHDPSK